VESTPSSASLGCWCCDFRGAAAAGGGGLSSSFVHWNAHVCFGVVGFFLAQLDKQLTRLWKQQLRTRKNIFGSLGNNAAHQTADSPRSITATALSIDRQYSVDSFCNSCFEN